MTYTVVADPDVEETFRKMKKRDAVRFEQVVKKLEEIGKNPEIGKPLRRPMQGRWRIHIGHYILLYKFDKKKRLVTLLKYTHHDEAY
jgi:addiction module RelE/StbE family toxin